jgi:hypothetical protein
VPNTTEPLSTWLFLKPLAVKRWVKLASMPDMAVAAAVELDGRGRKRGRDEHS